MARPDPTELAGSRSIATAKRSNFAGWWSVLNRIKLSTDQARALGRQGIPGACVGTLKHIITGLEWRVVDEEGQENQETEYYTLLLDNARDSTGEIIGFDHFLEKGAGDILCANEGWTYEVFRVPDGPYAGVPVNLIYMDAAELKPTGNPDAPVKQVPYGRENEAVVFRADEIGRAKWESYNVRGMEFYNLHPVYKAYVAMAMLAAEDDYTYEVMTQVIPQGLLNLGTGFNKQKALEWKQAWDLAKTGAGKLDDIGLLWGTDGADFIRFGAPPKDMPFQHASYWYLTTVTANFEMSPFDLGFMTQINTKAGSEQIVELSRNKGLRHLLKRLKRSIEQNVLPEGLFLSFPDLDPSDEMAEADVRVKNTLALKNAIGAGLLSLQEAREEAVRLEAYDIDPDSPDAPEGPPAPQSGSEEEDDGAEEEDAEEDTVRKAVRLIPNGASDPVPPLTDPDLDDEDLEKAAEVWDEEMAGFEGMLDADVMNREDFNA